MNLFFRFIVSFVLLAPMSVNAQIVISEIFYNAEGSDTGKEWVEVQNISDSETGLIQFKFFDGSNHKINEPCQVEVGGFAILVNKIEDFNVNYNYLGLVCDTVMSLNNTEGILKILDKDNVEIEIDSVTYNKEIGADGDGNSLQFIDGNLKACLPTMGVENIDCNSNTEEQNNTVEQEQDNASNDNDLNDIQTQTVENNTRWVPELKIQAYAGEQERTGIVGAPVFFEGQAIGLENLGLDDRGARFSWNFGDWSTKDGAKVQHVYLYKGEYPVVLNVSTGKHVATDRIYITILEADIIISNAKAGDKGFVEIKNNGKVELDLSKWIIETGRKSFIIPKNTFIGAGKTIISPAQVMNLMVDMNDLSLNYPNGSLVNRYKNQLPKDIYLKDGPQDTLDSTKQIKNKPLQPISQDIKKISKKEIIESISKNKESKNDYLTNRMDLMASVFKIKSNDSAKPASKDGESIFWWIGGLILIIILGSVTYLTSRDEDEQDIVDSYEIIEDEE